MEITFRIKKNVLCELNFVVSNQHKGLNDHYQRFYNLSIKSFFKILSVCIGFPCGMRINLFSDNIKLNITINVIYISITFIDIIVLIYLICNRACMYTNKRSHFYIRITRVFKVTFRRRLFRYHSFSNLRPLRFLKPQIPIPNIMSMHIPNSTALYNYCLKYRTLICQIWLL